MNEQELFEYFIEIFDKIDKGELYELLTDLNLTDIQLEVLESGLRLPLSEDELLRYNDNV
jgi:hypothetical protein